MVKPRPMYKKNGLLLGEMMRQGYTIRSLAKAVDVHYLTIWRIANRQHRPHRKTAARICEILDLTPRELGLEVWGKGKAEERDDKPSNDDA